VVLTHHFTDDFGALLGRAVGREAHLVHAIKNAPVHRLQPIADIRQGAAHDHAHGVIEVRAPHLVFDVDGNQIPVAVAGPGQRKLLPGRDRRILRRFLLVCQSGSFEVNLYCSKRLVAAAMLTLVFTTQSHQRCPQPVNGRRGRRQRAPTPAELFF
jgi:hypothetical protein